MNNYDNIDYCQNILYDLVYKKNHFKYNIKQNDNIKLIDIKKPEGFDFKNIFKSKKKEIIIYDLLKS